MAWLVHAGVAIFGDSAIGIRAAFPACAALATVAAFLAGRTLFGEAAGIFAALALNALPAFNTAAVHAATTAPLLLGILGAAWLTAVATEKQSIFAWISAGLFAAFAALFSGWAALLIPAMLAACAVSAHRRSHFHAPGIYLAILAAAFGLAPLFDWNFHHGWPALALGTFKTATSIRFAEIPAMFAATAAEISIPLLLAALMALGMLAITARVHFRPRLLLAVVAPFFLVAIYSLLNGSPRPDVIVPFAAIALLGLGEAKSRPVRLAAAALVVASAGLAAISLVRESRQPDPWPSAAREIRQLLASLPPAPPVFVIAQDSAMTALLSYHLRGSEVFLRESQDLSNQFGLWPRYDDFVETEKAPDEFFQELKATNPYMGRSALYVTREEFADLPQTITAAFADRKVTPLATLTDDREQVLRIYLCEDYQTMPL